MFYDEYLIYESAFSGIDNLYAVHISTGERYQITSARVGAYNPAISRDGDHLVYNDFSRLGNHVVKLPLEPQEWTPLHEVKTSNLAYYEPLSRQEGVTALITPAQIPQEQFHVEDYGGLGARINFHSWNIFPDATQPELSITSSNVLGTTGITGKVSYNRNEERLFKQMRAAYLGRYPIIQGGIGWGERVQPDTVTIQVGPADSAKSYATHIWSETSFDLQGAVPLINRKIGVDSESLMLSGKIQRVVTQDHIVRLTWPGREDLPDTTLGNSASDGTLFPLTFEARYSLFRERAPRDVHSRRSVRLSLTLTATPFESEFRGSRYGIDADLFLPGLLRHDGLRLSGAAEWKQDKGYPFRSLIQMPLGFRYRFHDRLTRLGARYKIPVAYPDGGIDKLPLLGWFRLGYVKRISLTVFGDLLRGEDPGGVRDYLTIGLAATLESSVLHLPFILPVSLVYAYRPQEGEGEFRISLEF